MKLKIFNTTGTASGEAELPSQFNEPVREDLVKKVVLAIQNNRRQPYGAYPLAGLRHSVKISKRRRDYKTSYGKGISRVPRKIMSHRGTQFFWVAATAPGTTGGRKAHPPKAGKVFSWKINDKERRKAVCSAMSAAMNKELVLKRGHIIPANYPFIVSEELESITKTKDLLAVLFKLGFENELERSLVKEFRAGKGKNRGRRTIVKKSLLLVLADNSKLKKAAANIPGVDCVAVKNLNTELLAPGTHVGRACIFTTKALDVLKTNIFTDKYVPSNTSNNVQSNKPAKDAVVKNAKKQEQKKEPNNKLNNKTGAKQ